MTETVMLIRILLAAILSGLIGFERELNGCAAGLRTHILVSVGSAVFMITSIMVAASYGGVGAVDPSRIASGVVTGIGFLGAGAIIRYGSSIRGLTTASSIWAVSAIGLATGAGVYAAAALATVVSLAVLILSRWEETMSLKKHGKNMMIRFIKAEYSGDCDIKKIIEMYGGFIKQISMEEDEDGKQVTIMLDLILSRVYHKEVMAEISSLAGVTKVFWEE